MCGRFWVRAHPGCPTSVAIVIPLSSNPNMCLLMSDQLLHNSSFGIFASSSHRRTCRRAHVPIPESEEEGNVALGNLVRVSLFVVDAGFTNPTDAETRRTCKRVHEQTAAR